MIFKEETLNEKVRNQLTPITNLICLIEQYGIDLNKVAELNPGIDVDKIKNIIDNAIPKSKESVNNIIKLTSINGEDTNKNNYK